MLVQVIVAGILDLVDYTRMHNQTPATTKKTNYPLTNFDDHSEECQEKTALITPDETGEFIRAMFGLMNSLFCFLKKMQKVLEPL